MSTSRRHGGRLRKLTHKQRAKKKAHNERTHRSMKIWEKKHVVKA